MQSIDVKWTPGSSRVFCQQEYFVMALGQSDTEFTPGVRCIFSNGVRFMNCATWKSHENADINFEHPRLNLKSCTSDRIAYRYRVNAWSTSLCSKSLELLTGKASNNVKWFASTLIIVNLNSATLKYNICLEFLSIYIKTSNTSLIYIHQ